jgi:hypothetical protein
VYAWIAVNVLAAPFQPGLQFQWSWSVAGSMAIFAVFQIWWLLMAYGFASLPNAFWRCFVVGILLWGVIRRITELPGSFHSHGVWVILRVAALLLEITAVAIGSAIVAKTWQEPQASV